MSYIAAAAIIGGSSIAASSIGSKKKKVKLPPQYYKAMDELLARGKADVGFPTRQIAPLSGLQQTGIDIGKEYIASPTSPDLNLATQTYSDLAAPGSILERPEVKGMISKATEEGNLMLNRMGRGMVMKGSFGSTPGRDQLGRGITAIQERISAAMSEYLNQAENRKLYAAGGLERTGLAKETTQQKKVAMGMSLGDLTRSIQQSIKDAQFNKLINEIQMKYVTQPAALASIMGQGGAVGTIEGGEPSMFAQASPLIDKLLTAAIMSGQPTSGGPGNWNVSPSLQGAQITDSLMQTR